jgi:hypothetical protein
MKIWKASLPPDCNGYLEKWYIRTVENVTSVLQLPHLQLSGGSSMIAVFPPSVTNLTGLIAEIKLGENDGYLVAFNPEEDSEKTKNDSRNSDTD